MEEEGRETRGLAAAHHTGQGQKLSRVLTLMEQERFNVFKDTKQSLEKLKKLLKIERSSKN